MTNDIKKLVETLDRISEDQPDLFPDAPEQTPSSNQQRDYKRWKTISVSKRRDAEVAERFPIDSRVKVNGGAAHFRNATTAQRNRLEGKTLTGTVIMHINQGRNEDPRWLMVKLDTPIKFRNRKEPVEKVYVSQFQAKLID